MDRLHLHFEEILEEVTLHIAIAWYGSDGRFFNLYDSGILALALVHTDVSIAEMLLCPCRNLALGEFVDAVQLLYVLLPRSARDIAVHHLADA